MSDSTIHMLVVGSSEVSMWMRGQQFLKETYGVSLKTDISAGRRLEECLLPVRARMERQTDILLIWSLTPWAWKRQTIYNGRRTTTVFGPDTSYSLDRVAPIMEEIVQAARRKNPSCNVYLALPAVKDMYTFNQKRIVKAWGRQYENMLQVRGLLGPTCMRNHSVQSYNDFNTLTEDRPKYWWTSKKCLRGSFAIGKIYKHKTRDMRKKGIIPPQTLYLSGRSNKLNLNCLPDGLHGTQEFLEAFCHCHKKIFCKPTNGPNVIVSFHNIESSVLDEEEEETETVVMERSNPVTNDQLSNEEGFLSVYTARPFSNNKIQNQSTTSLQQDDSPDKDHITNRPVKKWTPVVFDLGKGVGSDQKGIMKKTVNTAENVNLEEFVPEQSAQSEAFRVAWNRAVMPIPVPVVSPTNSHPLERVPPLGTNNGGLRENGNEGSVLEASLSQPSTSTDPRFLPTFPDLNNPRRPNELSAPLPKKAKIRIEIRGVTSRLIPSSSSMEVRRKIFDEIEAVLLEEKEILLFEEKEDNE